MKRRNSRKHWKQSCEGKMRYPTFQSAQQAVYHMQEKYKASFQSYHCRYCCRWHIGHVYFLC